MKVLITTLSCLFLATAVNAQAVVAAEAAAGDVVEAETATLESVIGGTGLAPVAASHLLLLTALTSGSAGTTTTTTTTSTTAPN